MRHYPLHTFDIVKYGGIGSGISSLGSRLAQSVARLIKAPGPSRLPSRGALLPPSSIAAPGKVVPPPSPSSVGYVAPPPARPFVGAVPGAVVPKASVPSATPPAESIGFATGGATPKALRAGRRRANFSPEDTGTVQARGVGESEYLMQGRSTFGMPHRPFVKPPAAHEIEWATPPAGVPEYRGPAKQFRYIKHEPGMGHVYYNPRTGETLTWDPKLDLELVGNPYGTLGYQWTPESLAKLERMAQEAIMRSRAGAPPALSPPGTILPPPL